MDKAPRHIAAEIDFKKNLQSWVVVVEGEPDRTFWKHQTQSASFVVAEGRGNLERAMELLGPEPGAVVALADADFDHLEARPLPHPQMVLTDARDLETTLLSLPRTSRKLFHEYPSEVNSSQQLFEIALVFGRLRWLGFRKRIAMDWLKPLNYLKNPGQSLLGEAVAKGLAVDCQQLEQELTDLAAHEPWQVCNGHDCLNILSDASKAKRPVLEKALRLAAEWAELEGTRMVKKLKELEQARGQTWLAAAS